MHNPTKLLEWQNLSKHYDDIKTHHMRDWFVKDKQRFTDFSLKNNGVLLDYSRNRITNKTIPLLSDLAYAMGLPEKITALFDGKPINITEKRPALHTALRDKNHTSIIVNGENIAPLIKDTQERLANLVERIHNQTWKGATGKPIKFIVNIGIGGSHHGPLMGTQALKEFAVNDLRFYFLSSVDQAHLSDVLGQIDAEATLFIISSKSFSTIETLTNAATVLNWMKAKLGDINLQQHFVAITANASKAEKFGIPTENIFPIWDWVGGRYSIWSAIGLPLMLMIGNDQFNQFLAGAHEMDQHFQQAEFAVNMPVLLGLLSIWYTNFFGASAQAIVPYAHRLRHLIPYLQQAEMESNGKRMSINSTDVTYTTGSIIFGEEGCDGQHTYHQLLHQGQHFIPVDFILAGQTHLDATHQDILIASALSQAQALMRGKTYDEAYHELNHLNPDEAKHLAHHQIIPGNRPSNILFLERISPKTLGALLALYEHKIFVQSAIWDINPFDQWGVELGKQLLPHIINSIHHGTGGHLDCATQGLIHHYQSLREKND